MRKVKSKGEGGRWVGEDKDRAKGRPSEEKHAKTGGRGR